MGRTSDAKEKLLHVAFDLIWNSSYGTVSVDQICGRAEVNKGSFYHFFPSKADLAVAAQERHWKLNQPELDRIFSSQAPPLERLARWCRHICQAQKEKAEKYGHICGCPYASMGAELATQDEKIRAKSLELMERGMRYVETAIAEARREGLISTNDPRKAARRAYSVLLGMLIQAKVQNDLEVLNDLEATVMDLIGAKTMGGRNLKH